MSSGMFFRTNAPRSRASGIRRIWYNNQVKRRIPSILSALLLVPLILCSISLPADAQDASVDSLIARIQKSLQDRDWISYGNVFIPEIRQDQREIIISYFDNLGMEQVSAFPVRTDLSGQEEPALFFQVFYQNSYSALFETWKLTLVRSGDGWEVKNKEVTRSLSNLFKIRIPSDRVEKAASVEINHVDFKITFQDAYVFYDNIPHLETALLIIGKGQVRFTPSDATEKHQLDLVYKKDKIEEKIEYVFLRFSNSFFNNNIKIRNAVPVVLTATSAEEAPISQAYSIFSEHYLRFYVIQHSLSRDPLSFLPQGDEAVIEFKGEKYGEFAYIYSPFTEEEVNLYDSGKDQFISLYSPSETEGQKRMFIKFSQKFHVKHYDIDVNFNPEQRFLSAKARIEILPQVEDLDSLKFRIDPKLEILRVYDAERRELVFTQDKGGKVIYVYFLSSLAKETPTSIEIYYRGRLEFPLETADVVAAPQYSTSTLPKFNTYLCSQAVYWYPFPPGEDYFTSRLRLIIPPDFEAVATGELAERGILNGIQRVTEIDKIGNSYFIFSSKLPVKYLSFIIGKFNKLQDVTEPFPFQYYITENIRFPKKNAQEEALSIVQFYESLFGPYPYSSLRIVHRAWIYAGGHSPASFVVLNELPFSPDDSLYSKLVIRGDNPVDLSQWPEYFLAHEIAHQWWGQGVTWAKYKDQWLSEGLAQFSSFLYLKSKYSRRAVSSILKRFADWTEKKSQWGPITIGSRLSFFDRYAYQAIVYDKASLVLNMLMDMLGEDVFFTGLKEFFADYKFGPASTGDFLRVMEKASGRDLKAFSHNWFNSHLLPEVRTSSSVLNKENGYVLKVRVEQLRDIFVFPLWVTWEENGQARAEKMMVKDKIQEAEFILPGKPRNIKINPDHAVPGKFD